MNNAVPIEARMAFAKASDVQPDTARPGMLRAATHPVDADIRAVTELKVCHPWDWSAISMTISAPAALARR